MLNKYFLMRQIHSIKTHLEQEGMGIEVTASGSSWLEMEATMKINSFELRYYPPTLLLFCWLFAPGLCALWWEKGCPPSVIQWRFYLLFFKCKKLAEGRQG